MNYFLETKQITVVHVGLHKTRVRYFAYIASCGRLELAFKEGQKLSPGKIGRRAVEAIEEKTYAFVSKARPKRIPCETELIRSVFRIPRENDVPWKADVVISEVGEQRSHAGGHAVIRSLGRIRPPIQMAGVALCFATE